jgi:hypothetical protein
VPCAWRRCPSLPPEASIRRLIDSLLPQTRNYSRISVAESNVYVQASNQIGRRGMAREQRSKFRGGGAQGWSEQPVQHVALEINGTRISPAESGSLTLRRDRVDKESSRIRTRTRQEIGSGR